MPAVRQRLVVEDFDASCTKSSRAADLLQTVLVVGHYACRKGAYPHMHTRMPCLMCDEGGWTAWVSVGGCLCVLMSLPGNPDVRAPLLPLTDLG